MMISLRFKNFKKISSSQSGQALALSLVSILILGIVGGLVVSQSSRLNARAVDQEKNESLTRVQRTLETILSNNFTCTGSPTGLRGLQFVNAGAEGNNLLQGAALIARPPGNPIPSQNVSVEILQKTAGGVKIIARGNDGVGPSAVLPDFNLTIDRLYITNVTEQAPAGSNKFDADFFIQATVGGNSFAPRNIGRMFMEVDATNTLISCTITPSAQAACQQMNCTWTATSTAGKNNCVCGFPAVSCPGAVAGQPRQYLSGVDSSVFPPTPICSNFLVSCKNPPYGPGFFLAGVNTDGTPICQPLEDYTPPTCTGGASTTVTVNPAAPGGCYCPAGQTWNGLACAAPLPLVCTGGATTTASAVPASPAGCFCLAVQTWDGTSCGFPSACGAQAGGTHTWQMAIGGAQPATATNQIGTLMYVDWINPYGTPGNGAPCNNLGDYCDGWVSPPLMPMNPVWMFCGP